MVPKPNVPKGPGWRVANALKTLREQVNKAAPNRSKSHDGTIGDAAHQSRASDHNPWVKDGNQGVVTGMDITHDPAKGVDSYVLAQTLLDSRDHRIKYIISNGRIASGSEGPQPWVWRKYSGKNPHNKHVHVSVKSEKVAYDGIAPWKISYELPRICFVNDMAPIPAMFQRAPWYMKPLGQR